jgi:hypothetical protein
MTSSTSPYFFKEASKRDIQFIENGLKEHPYVIFIRKISCDFPDDILNDFIYIKTQEKILWWIWFKPFFLRKCFTISINIIIATSFLGIITLSVMLSYLLIIFLIKHIPYQL